MIFFVCGRLCGSVAKSNFGLTFLRDFDKLVGLLGDRSTVGRRVLAPLIEVRVLVPQPVKL